MKWKQWMRDAASAIALAVATVCVLTGATCEGTVKVCREHADGRTVCLQIEGEHVRVERGK